MGEADLWGPRVRERERGWFVIQRERGGAHAALARYWASAFVKSRWATGEGESGSGPWGRSGPSGQIGRGRFFFFSFFFKAIFKSFSNTNLNPFELS